MARNQMRLDDETAEMVDEVRKSQEAEGIETSEAGTARMLVKWGYRDWKRLQSEVAPRKGVRHG